jgi:hypothetical protein
VPSLRTADNRRASRCASAIGNGISSGVSRHANPNIIPWSPAPWASKASAPDPWRSSSACSTPCAMSGDCVPIETETPHEAASKPFFDES